LAFFPDAEYETLQKMIWVQHTGLAVKATQNAFWWLAAVPSGMHARSVLVVSSVLNIEFVP
jgi:hypothetical protein